MSRGASKARNPKRVLKMTSPGSLEKWIWRFQMYLDFMVSRFMWQVPFGFVEI